MERTFWFSTNRGDRLDVVTGTFPFVSDLIHALATILGVPKGKESHVRLFLQSDTPLLPCDLVEDVVGPPYGWNPRVEGSRYLHVLLPPALGSQRDVGVAHRIRAAEQLRKDVGPGAERPSSAYAQRFAPAPPRPSSAQHMRPVQPPRSVLDFDSTTTPLPPPHAKEAFGCEPDAFTRHQHSSGGAVAYHRDVVGPCAAGVQPCHGGESLSSAARLVTPQVPHLSSSSSLPTKARHWHDHQQQAPLISWVVEVFHAHEYDATFTGDSKALLFSTRVEDVRPLPNVAVGAGGWAERQPPPQPLWTYTTVQEYFLSLVTAERCFLKSLLYLDPEFQEFVMFTPKTVPQILQASRVRALVVPMLKSPPSKVPPYCDVHASPSGFMACAHERMPPTLVGAPHPPARTAMFSPRRPESQGTPVAATLNAQDHQGSKQPRTLNTTTPPQRSENTSAAGHATTDDHATCSHNDTNRAAGHSDGSPGAMDLQAAVEKTMQAAQAANRLERLDDIWQREEFAMDLFIVANAARDRMLEAQLQEAIQRTEVHGISNRALASLLKFDGPEAAPHEAQEIEEARQRHQNTLHSSGHRHYHQSSVLRAALEHALPRYAQFATTPDDKATIRTWLGERLKQRLDVLEGNSISCSTPELVERLVADVTAVELASPEGAHSDTVHASPEDLRQRMRDELTDRRRLETMRQDAAALQRLAAHEDRDRASAARVSEARMAPQREQEAKAAALRAADALHKLEAAQREVQEKDAALRALASQLEALREAEKKEHLRREEESRIVGRREREAARRELEALEAAQREAESRDAAWREVEARERTRREVEALEAMRELERQKTAKLEAEAREAAWRALEAREAAVREAEAREHARKEMEVREAAEREASAREAARREQEARDAAHRAQQAQDAARKELEVRQAARRELDTQEAARHKLDALEAARQEEAALQAAKHEAEVRASERRALAAREAREDRRRKLEAVKRELDAREDALRAEEASLAAKRALAARKAETAQRMRGAQKEAAQTEDEEEEEEDEAEEEEEDEEEEEEEEEMQPLVGAHVKPKSTNGEQQQQQQQQPSQVQAPLPSRGGVVTTKVTTQEMEQLAEAFDFPLSVVKGIVIECRGDSLRVTERLERASAERAMKTSHPALPSTLTHGTEGLVVKIKNMMGSNNARKQEGDELRAVIQALNEAKGNARTALELLVERGTQALPQHLAVQITLDKMNREYEAKRALHKLKAEEAKQQLAPTASPPTTGIAAAAAAAPPPSTAAAVATGNERPMVPPSVPVGTTPKSQGNVRPTSAAAALRITTSAAPDDALEFDDSVFEIEDDDDDDEEIHIDDDDDDDEAEVATKQATAAQREEAKSPWIEHVVEPMVSSAVGAYLSRSSSMISATASS